MILGVSGRGSGKKFAPLMYRDADHALAALETELKTVKRDRDELWCRAVTTLEDTKMVAQVLVRFDQLRPD